MLVGTFGGMAALSFLVAFLFWIVATTEGLWATIVASIASLVCATGLIGVCLYGIADDKVEYEMFLPVETIGNSQYVQYQDPATGDPVLYNVNYIFERKFDQHDRIKVTIYSAGPYNGVYGRPNPGIEVPNMDRPPEPPPLYEIAPCPPSHFKNDKQRRRGVKRGTIQPCCELDEAV